jgi:glycosyltransferase involved in cell wall biosynthesis
MAPQVSVIIPTYNRADQVREALASVEAQTYRDFEIVVVDDGGTDGTFEALATGREIRVCRHASRRGVSAARNTGINAARGKWLAFLDSDDLWLPDKLARQIFWLEGQPELLICQTEETWVRRGVRVNKPLSHRQVGGRIFLPSLSRCMISPSAVMLDRRLISDHGGFDETLPAAEDYDLWLRLTWRYEVGLVDEPLVIKRGGHPDQLSRQWGLDRFRIRALVKLVQEPDLPEPYARAARRMLAAKCALYAQGCAKRGRQTEAAWYWDLSRAAGLAPGLNAWPLLTPLAGDRMTTVGEPNGRSAT